VVVLFLALICAPGLQAQDSSTTKPEPATTKPQNQSATKPDDATRVVGVIPAFNVSNDINAPALTASQKFHLFTKTSKDPFNLIMPAINAVILSSGGVSSGYGSGFGGFAKKYGSSIADSISGNFFRLYAFPALLHEDPRYFRMDHGPVGKRTLHCFTSTVWTRTDDATFRFNWSKLLGTSASAGLSNAYYPAENRGAKLTFSRIGLSYLMEVGTNSLKEFWPDLARKRKKKK